MGFFVRAPVALGNPSPILADNIDPETRDFASLAKGADPIDAQVQLAVTTQRSSGAAVIEDGVAVTPTKMDRSVENQIAADYRQALQRLVRRGDIRITQISFDRNEPENQTVQVRIAYVNLRAADGQVRTFDVPKNLPGRII